MISRSGSSLWTYPPEHRHRVLTLPPPRRGGDGYDGREDFVRYFCRELQRARAIAAREHPDESPVVLTERVLKAWEPHLPEILARVPARGTARAAGQLRQHGGLVAGGVMPYTAGIVQSAMGAGGQVAVTTGRVDEIRGTEAGTLVLSVSAPGSGSASRIEADLVISNFGLMRLLDLRSDDATKITTGFAVSQEPNPDLGLHGARWLLASRNYPLAFRALRAGVRNSSSGSLARTGS